MNWTEVHKLYFFIYSAINSYIFYLTKYVSNSIAIYLFNVYFLFCKFYHSNDTTTNLSLYFLRLQNVSFNLLVAISTVKSIKSVSLAGLPKHSLYFFYVSQNNYMLEVYISAYIHIFFSVWIVQLQGSCVTHWAHCSICRLTPKNLFLKK